MKRTFSLIFITFIAFLQQLKLDDDNLNKELCYQDVIHNTSVCRLICPSGTFYLPGMISCHPWIKCDADITIISLISVSVVKTVYLAKWKGYTVVLSVLSSLKYKEDFLHNLNMLKSFSPHNDVVQLLGYCDYSLLTEYYELGNALNIKYHLQHSLKVYDNIKVRLKLCLSYVSILNFLHNSPVGIRVMCDSNTLEKTLSQFLITPELKLVVNDLDATPLIDASRNGIHCGKRKLSGTFIAPEQIWPFPDKEFDTNEMPLYDEKTDIYKVPDVCSWFLGNSPDADVIKYKLFNIHRSCKNSDPCKRPDAHIILKAYETVLNNAS